MLTDHGVDLGAHVGDELLVEADGGVVAFHGILDQFDVDVGRVADVGLPTAAEEIQVLGTF
ncbi:hypothetical protein [Haloechinothrix salitolerans]|uniref:Uncharacterized protein n=1 Tax=Haloechinothrix salitolerans TaxID=926830 RepID=A0ABW2BVG9_9PSEU